ncbi:MAG: zf-HC2 domain-containing protein [Vicinamibacteraceae bacterium]
MAHADHDQVFGRLAGARLRGTAESRLGGAAAAAEAHPDAETWAAYVDGGLLVDEVSRLEAHLAGCGACRRLVAAFAPEVSVAAPPAVRVAEAPATAGATILAFPRRRVFAYMAIAATLFGAVTLWSVSRLGTERPAAEFAATRAVGDTPGAAAGSPMPAPSTSPASPSPADPASRADAPAAGDRDGQAALLARRKTATAEVDKLQVRLGGADAASRQAAATGARGRTERDTAGGAPAGGAASGGPAPAEEKRLADAAASVPLPAAPPAPAPAAGARAIQLQTNSVAAGATRPHGPLSNQAANAQQNAPVAQAPAPAIVPVTPVAAVAAPPPAAPAPAPARAPADARTAKADSGAAKTDGDAAQTREQRANEQAATVSEIVTTTGAALGRAARPQPARGQAAGADRSGPAVSKDESAKTASFAAGRIAVVPTFAEPGGRLLWRIAADGRRIESSSDGGTTWNLSHNARRRLRGGTAPSIDSAWAVGDRGLVLRLTVPGGWAAVAPPEDVTLTAVSAANAHSARVTAADGRAFETADGGATWTPATPGAGPQ